MKEAKVFIADIRFQTARSKKRRPQMRCGYTARCCYTSSSSFHFTARSMDVPTVLPQYASWQATGVRYPLFTLDVISLLSHIILVSSVYHGPIVTCNEVVLTLAMRLPQVYCADRSPRLLKPRLVGSLFPPGPFLQFEIDPSSSRTSKCLLLSPRRRFAAGHSTWISPYFK